MKTMTNAYASTEGHVVLVVRFLDDKVHQVEVALTPAEAQNLSEQLTTALGTMRVELARL